MDSTGIILIDPQDIPMRPGPNPEQISAFSTLQGACPGAALPGRSTGGSSVGLNLKDEPNISPDTPPSSPYHDRDKQELCVEFLRKGRQPGWVLAEVAEGNEDLEDADAPAFPANVRGFDFLLCWKALGRLRQSHTFKAGPSFTKLELAKLIRREVLNYLHSPLAPQVAFDRIQTKDLVLMKVTSRKGNPTQFQASFMVLCPSSDP